MVNICICIWLDKNLMWSEESLFSFLNVFPTWKLKCMYIHVSSGNNISSCQPGGSDACL